MAATLDAPSRHPRHRLVALRGPAPTAGREPARDAEGTAVPGGRDRVPGETPGAPGASPMSPAVQRHPGRLVRRWLPAGGQGYRFDPGRRGALVLAAVVLLAAAVAGTAVWRARPVAEPVPALAAVEVSGATTAGGDLVVSVAGPVARPGLVRLRPGARVADAIDAAGGPLPGADLTGTNLARRLTDGEHVVVGAGAGQAAGTAQSGSGSRVDLNTATLAELDALPGIGPVTAQRILDWRAAHGRFASVEQLREIDGIGETRFARLKDLVMA